MNLRWISSFSVMPEMSPLGVFFRGIFVFLPGWQCHACNAYARIQKISYFHAFSIKIIFFHFRLKKKYHIFWKKEIPSFQILQKRSCSGANFLERPSFQNIWRKYHISRYFFEKDHLPFGCLKNKIIFQEKEISSFLIIQERSYSSAIFFERPSFQNIWKRKIWFFVQCVSWHISHSDQKIERKLWSFTTIIFLRCYRMLGKYQKIKPLDICI